MIRKDMTERPLILITNDDGILAQGIQELTSLMCTLGDVAVVAPDGPRSGMACAISAVTPVRLQPVGPQKQALRRIKWVAARPGREWAGNQIKLFSCLCAGARLHTEERRQRRRRSAS